MNDLLLFTIPLAPLLFGVVNALFGMRLPIALIVGYPLHGLWDLLHAGDWACAHGDMDGLRQVVRDLARCLPEPMHCELEEIITSCDADPDRAAALWARLRDRVYRDGSLARR